MIDIIEWNNSNENFTESNKFCMFSLWYFSVGFKFVRYVFNSYYVEKFSNRDFFNNWSEKNKFKPCFTFLRSSLSIEYRQNWQIFVIFKFVKYRVRNEIKYTLLFFSYLSSSSISPSIDLWIKLGQEGEGKGFITIGEF